VDNEIFMINSLASSKIYTLSIFMMRNPYEASASAACIPDRQEVVRILGGNIVKVCSPESTPSHAQWVMAQMHEFPPIQGSEMIKIGQYAVSELRRADVTYNTVCNVSPTALWLATLITILMPGDECNLVELSKEARDRGAKIWTPINGSYFQPDRNILLVHDTTDSNIDITQVVKGISATCAKQGVTGTRVIGVCATYETDRFAAVTLATQGIRHIALMPYENLQHTITSMAQAPPLLPPFET
jgi:hypothetical protein